MRYALKSRPEDFRVEEILKVKASEEEKIARWKESVYGKESKYLWVFVERRGVDFFSFLKGFSEFLGISEDEVKYAGIKDRVAVSRQYISLRLGVREKIEEFRMKGVKILGVVRASRHLSSRDIKCNRFRVVVRFDGVLSDGEVGEIKRRVEQVQKNGFLNLFGEQRFGKNLSTLNIGRKLVKRRFEEAVDLIARNEKALLCREFFKNKENGDYIRALKTLPKNFLSFFVSAVQSKVWNDVAIEVSTRVNKNVKIPLPGYETDVKDEPVRSVLSKVMKREGICFRDFFFKEVPWMSLKGSERSMLSYPLFREVKGRGEKLTLVFDLERGSYATVLLKHLLGNFTRPQGF